MTIMPENFAPRFPRNRKGHIKFPADADVRKEIFPVEVMKHPAKANLFMLQAIIDYIPYKAGEVILDPMSGTGSIMIAALSGCRVICIDCSPGYYELLEQSRERVLEHSKDTDITILEGDCLDYLPIPVDHICFSPPYSTILVSKQPSDFAKEAFQSYDIDEIARYWSGKGNVGLLPEFFYIQAMEKVYKKCLESLKPGGTMTLITKDHMEAGRRIYLTRKNIKAAERMGFSLSSSFKCEAHGTAFLSLFRSRGMETVEDEDISILRKL